MTTQTSPETLRTAVYEAVREGAWTAADVVASVATDYVTERAAIVATLWDLVDDGVLRYEGCCGFAGFRPRA
jgi:aryl-alcohol dehydrogenase-like predicted oxidoreductase